MSIKNYITAMVRSNSCLIDFVDRIVRKPVFKNEILDICISWVHILSSAENRSLMSVSWMSVMNLFDCIFFISDYDLNLVCNAVCEEETLKCIVACDQNDTECLSVCIRAEAACANSKYSFSLIILTNNCRLSM